MKVKHRKNLEILRDSIYGIPEEFLNMNHYRQEKFGDITMDVSFNSMDDCGTIGCIMGWSPFIKGLEGYDYFVGGGKGFGLSSGVKGFAFYSYAMDTFGFNSGDLQWDWIFSEKWNGVDNTSIGAAIRIDYLLENGKVPDEFTGKSDSYRKDLHKVA